MVKPLILFMSGCARSCFVRGRDRNLRGARVAASLTGYRILGILPPMPQDDPPPCRIYDYSAGERPNAAYWAWFDEEFGLWTRGSRGRRMLRAIEGTLRKTGKWRGHLTTIHHDPTQDRMTVYAHYVLDEAMQLTWAELLDLVRARLGR
jgi:hypothetical protein